MVSRHSQSQCVKDPTRNCNILDLVFTTNPDLVKSTIVSEGMSDHDLVITELDLKMKPPKKKPRKIFLFKRADVERLGDSIPNDVEALCTIECKSASELDDLWAKFKSTILKAVEQYVPHKKISGWRHVRWLTLPLKRAIRKKQRLYRKAKQLQTRENWAKFKKFRKATKSKLLEAYNNYVFNLLDSTTNPDLPILGKRFWCFIKSMKKDNVGISPLKENGIGEAMHDSRKKADLLSEQFKSVFTQDDLENLPSLPQAFPNISQLHFDTVGIAKLLSNLDVKRPLAQIKSYAGYWKMQRKKLPHSWNGFFHFHCRQGMSRRTGKKQTYMPSSKKETGHLPWTTDLSPSLLFPVKSWNILYLTILCTT